MFKLHLLVLGKLKENHWREAETEYLKRLKPYAKIRVTELSEEQFREEDNRDKIKEKEALKILKNVGPNSILVALHERGKEYTSVELANFLNEKTAQGEEIVFVIGGPLGLHDNILKQTNHQLSLSRLTFPHQMVRTILLEQIYRSATIVAGKTYHY